MSSENTKDKYAQLYQPRASLFLKNNSSQEAEIISLRDRIEINEQKRNTLQRKEKIQKIINYAESLNW